MSTHHTATGSLQRVFISYGHDEHAELALRLKADLEQIGHSVWLDKSKIKAGKDWEMAIEEGLRDAQVVLALLTPHAVRRPDGVCLDELSFARFHKKQIVPLMVQECARPLSIYRLQYLDARDYHKTHRYSQILSMICEVLDGRLLSFEGAHAELLRELSPIEFGAEIDEHVRGFVGRDRIFRQVEDWLADDCGARVFLLTGPPGVGKTAIAAMLCHRHPAVAAYHLCIAGHDEKSNALKCVRSLAYQLSTQIPDYCEFLMHPRLSDSEGMNAKTAFDTLIVQPLHEITPPNERKLIVIDALNEATDKGRNQLAEFIAEMFDLTPKWLRLFVTSQPNEPVMSTLPRLTTYCLDLSSQANTGDIEEYVKLGIAQLGGEAAADKVIPHIVGRSEGIFLYAKVVLQEIAQGRLSLERPNEFPQGLASYYKSYFRRQFSTDGETSPDYDLYQRPLLELVAAARVPLRVDLAARILGLTHEDERKGRLDPLEPLFTFRDGVIRPFHQSVIAWLTDTETSRDFFIDRGRGDERLADFGWNEFLRAADELDDYFVSYLPVHLMELKRWMELRILAASPKLQMIERWVERGDDIGPKCLNGLIEHGRLDRVQQAALATQVARVHSHRGEYPEAAERLNWALEQTSWLRGRRVRAVAIHELGSLRLYQGDRKTAAGLFREALSLCAWGLRAHRDEAAANRIALATVASQEYRWPAVLRLSRRALKEARSVGDIRHAVAAQRLIGFTLESLARYEEAESVYAAALAESQDSGTDLETARLYVLLGCLHYARSVLHNESLAEAPDYLRRAFDEAVRIHNLYTQIDARLRLGWCALAEDRTRYAQEQFQYVGTALVGSAHLELRVGAQLGLTAVSHQDGELERACADYRMLADEAEQHGFLGYGSQALVGLGATHWHRGRCADAEAAWAVARRRAKLNSPRIEQITQVSVSLSRTAATVTPR